MGILYIYVSCEWDLTYLTTTSLFLSNKNGSILETQWQLTPSMFTFIMLFYVFALVIFEVGSTFADSSATAIDEVIPQMMAGRGHEESIFHGT